MIARRGSFPFGDAPVINSAQQVQGNYQAGYFSGQMADAFLNVKSYTFSLNVVIDALDEDVALLETTALTLAAGMIGPGGALAGLAIGATEFLAGASARVGVSGITTRKGYVNEMVPTNAVYSAAGTYSLAVNSNRFYWWIPSTNEISAKNGTMALLPGTKFLSQANTITLTGAPSQPVTASVVSRGARDIFAQNLCLVMIDWGAVVRRPIGSKQGIGGILYYPLVSLLFYASYYFLATDVTLLSGAGNITGGINITNGEGVITSINALTSAGPPIGQPSCFGQIQPNERYDNIKVAIANNVATITGVTFNNLAGATGPVNGVFLEEQQLAFTVSADMQTLTAQLPQNASGYLIFRPTTADVYSTRQPI